MRVRRVVLAVMLIVGLTSGLQAHADSPDVDALMQEDFQQFDQHSDSGWNVQMFEMKYPEAVEAIQDYSTTHAGKLATWQQGSLDFHLGRVYALEGQRDHAVAAFRQALATQALGNPAYVEAFIAFLEGDREALVKDRDVVATTNPGPWQAADLDDVDEMLKYFGKPYEVAFGALTCVDNKTPVTDALLSTYCQVLLKKYATLYQGH